VRPGSEKAEAEELLRSSELTPDYDDGQNAFSDDVAKGKVVTTNPPPGTEVAVNQRVVIVISKGREPKPVPDVRDQPKDDAFEQLKDDGFDPVEGTPEFDPDVEGGHVIRTDPEAGTKLDGDDRKVTVTLSSAVTVPDLRNKNAKEATDELEGLGLKVEVQRFGGGRRVFQQSPGPNSRVETGSTVTLFLFG
jgi:serine/threonine-protein kinase